MLGLGLGVRARAAACTAYGCSLHRLRLQTDAGVIALKTIAAFTFLGYGVVGGKHLYPKLEHWLSQITFVKGASIQPRDEVHLVIMILSLVLYAFLGSLIGSHPNPNPNPNPNPYPNPYPNPNPDRRRDVSSSATRRARCRAWPGRRAP